MKFFAALALSLLYIPAFCQTVTVPANTNVKMELATELFEGKSKVGSAAQFRVTEDVVVDGVVIIPAKSAVRAAVTISKNRELRVELYDVKAADGTLITLADCWIFTTAAQNQRSKGAAIWVGTRKNCGTLTRVEVKSTGAKY